MLKNRVGPSLISRSYRFLFSLNLSWIFVFYASNKPMFFHWLYFLHFDRELYSRIRTHEPEIAVVQVFWSVILAIPVNLILRMLSISKSSAVWLESIAGIIVLAGFPLCAIYRPVDFFQPTAYQNNFAIPSIWLVCEVGIVVLCGLLYLVKWSRIPVIVVAFPMFVHFLFWAYLTGSDVNPVTLARGYGSLRMGFWFSLLFYWGFPVFGFLVALLWSLHVRAEQQQPFSSAHAYQAT
jgi:hypothetical protein